MVSINLGDPEFEKVLCDRLQQFMDSYEGHWIIRVVGSQQSPIWHLKVEAPDGTREWVTALHGEEGGRSIDNILIELQRILEKNQ